jgi:hypothetical protein
MEMKEPDVNLLVFLTITISLFDGDLIINNWHWISKLVILLRLADVVKFIRASNQHLPLSDDM